MSGVDVGFAAAGAGAGVGVGFVAVGGDNQRRASGIEQGLVRSIVIDPFRQRLIQIVEGYHPSGSDYEVARFLIIRLIAKIAYDRRFNTADLHNMTSAIFGVSQGYAAIWDRSKLHHFFQTMLKDAGLGVLVNPSSEDFRVTLMGLSSLSKPVEKKDPLYLSFWSALFFHMAQIPVSTLANLMAWAQGVLEVMQGDFSVSTDHWIDGAQQERITQGRGHIKYAFMMDLHHALPSSIAELVITAADSPDKTTYKNIRTRLQRGVQAEAENARLVAEIATKEQETVRLAAEITAGTQARAALEAASVEKDQTIARTEERVVAMTEGAALKDLEITSWRERIKEILQSSEEFESQFSLLLVNAHNLTCLVEALQTKGNSLFLGMAGSFKKQEAPSNFAAANQLFFKSTAEVMTSYELMKRQLSQLNRDESTTAPDTRRSSSSIVMGASAEAASGGSGAGSGSGTGTDARGRSDALNDTSETADNPFA